MALSIFVQWIRCFFYTNEINLGDWNIEGGEFVNEILRMELNENCFQRVIVITCNIHSLIVIDEGFAPQS